VNSLSQGPFIEVHLLHLSDVQSVDYLYLEKAKVYTGFDDRFAFL